MPHDGFLGQFLMRAKGVADADADADEKRSETSPFDDVYCTSKLTKVWHRAQQTSAYAPLGPFSTRAFLDLPATSKEDSRPGP
ncbi:hypothetical protein CF54_16105 [Streptomyces sp. Tu 6176]|uniref:hypothetical protein n=1 Tax=Streptomyces sp. Tu 6176 TaxID=1470557 RepID=UPI00044E0676|nr:hypothetical protein [Streptomyces sp. Tu 6176]EYT81981.1 hypothetical protein CF54_16105 [Streptomyces sp. Tu 6176]